MIDVKPTEVDGTDPSQGILITLRNGFTYIMMTICRPMNKFVNYAGFEKFLRAQTIRIGNISTLRLTLIMEKEQMLLIPALVSHIREDSEDQVPADQQLYYSVSVYKTNMPKHKAPTEAARMNLPAMQYGMDLYNPITKNKIGYVSNLVYFKDYRYFLCEMQQPCNSTVVANSKGIPIGLLVTYGKMRICIACRDILDANNDFNHEIPTDDRTRSLLMRTCYIECGGQYGTGVVLEGGKKVMTAKHVIPETSRNIGQEVHLSLYPFVKIMFGRVCCVNELCDYLQISLSEQDAVPLLKNVVKDNNLRLGVDIVAIGFGKYNFSLNNFTSGFLLPTLQKGIISKNIKHRDLNVFIKTDAHLCNGFSGCGIWSELGLIGMAVFIVVNGRKKLYSHNYSYTLKFLESEVEEHRDFLKSFDQIYLRERLPIYPKL